MGFFLTCYLLRWCSVDIQQQIRKAEKLVQDGQLDSAVKSLQNIVTKFPRQAQAQGLLGLLYILKKDYNLAEKCLIHSLQSDFNEAVAKNLTLLLIQENRWQDAYTWSQKLVIKAYRDIEVKLNHALILRNMNKMDGALDIYKKLLIENPEYIKTYISYGFTLNLLERYEEATKVYLLGLKIQPKEFTLLYNLGITYLNQFDYDNALQYMNLALNQNNQSINLWLTIAVCYAKKRDLDAAFSCIKEAEKINPNNLLVPFQMGSLLLQQDRNEEAIDWLNKVINKEPEHIEANYHIGLIYLKKEKYQEAVRYYRYRIKRLNQRFGKFNDFDLPKLSKDLEVVISWEQGIGDEILYLGLLKNIQKKIKSITYISQDKLCDWIKLNFSDIQVIKETESVNYLQVNPSLIQLNIGSLMAYIENWDDFFKIPSVWKVDENLYKKYLQKYKQNNEKILGISWMSANKKIGDEKSIPLNKLASIIRNNKTISLQYGDVLDEINYVNQENAINIIQDDELDYFNDINSLAALISICDIVVTCSNVTAHIAGRLGIKTYLMIPKFFGNIWYWNESQNQSKWYPSVTIVRQKKDMSWDDPIQEVKKQLSCA